MPDLVVDSSVWIDYFNKKNSEQVEHLEKLLLATALVSPIIIFPVIMQEVLQGLVNDISFNTIKENLQGLEYLEYDAYKFSVEAAQLYRFLRRKGATVRKANDCLIAALCIDNDIPLFHKDKDFDNIAKYTSLKIYKIK
jgi:predicted nucleic acid-binding protein